MTKALRSLLTDDRGQGLAEYGMILGLVAVVCIAAVGTLGTQIQTTLNTVAAAI